jgi:hypothetical protein
MVLQVCLADNTANETFSGSSPGLALLEKSARKRSIVEGWFAARRAALRAGATDHTILREVYVV